MPDTRPGIRFDDNGTCFACINYEKQKNIDWKERWTELEQLCDKYRGSNGNGYDCAIAVSGGKDSHFQIYILKLSIGMGISYGAQEELLFLMRMKIKQISLLISMKIIVNL